MSQVRIDTLDSSSPPLVESCVTLLFNAFASPELYGTARLHEELRNLPPPFYRQFFIASIAGEIVGVGGVKAADWASDTHLLYLSAVAPGHRRQGIGRRLVEARLDWLLSHFKHGRILVSSAKNRRFRELGFRPVAKSGLAGRQLLLRRF
jgi:predicted N-acetyltransferase YhbS